ncbi:MAG: DUF1572 domain-containing protein [Chitinophagaceae bacterium]|nr:DUF1572 domain-containing protein [Chitinophagaceae bacterium]
MISADMFVPDVLARFNHYKSLADRTFTQLKPDEWHWRPSPESNSIAIIVQHLYGNMMSRFTHFLTEDGEKPWRRRDAEFETMDMTAQDLLDCWATGWSHVLNTVGALTDEQLTQEVTIRGEPMRAYDAVLRQLAHYSYHIGQIVTMGKMLRDQNWQNLSIPKMK